MLATFSPQFEAGPRSPGCGMTEAGTQQIKRRSKQEIAEAFIFRLRERKSIDLEAPGFIEGIKQHFQLLPTRYALDVNTSGLDVLNHKRLLDSARADPSAVSFQVRPVDVSIPPYGNGHSSMDKRPSFGGLETLLSEVQALYQTHNGRPK
jgi:hypothetical protein